MMRRLLVLLAIGALSGCTPTLVMKNPATGDIVACGPATMKGADFGLPPTQAEQRCIDQYQHQGYVRQ